MSTLRIAAWAAGVVCLSAMVGCSEDPQLLEGQPMGTTVTRDTQSWEGDPLTFQAQYTRGDRESWEAALNKRVQGQNEYIRIGD